MVSFSIVICTYNPPPDILQRLLNAVMAFQTTAPEHEIIIVDNNSTTLLAEQTFIQQFVVNKPDTIILRETTPGLTAARIAGIKKAAHDWVIFFDDDNVPAADYLPQAANLVFLYPQVGAWGPGRLDVCYVGKQTPFLTKIKWLFQQRNYEGTHFDNNIVAGSEYYPFGTGMVVRKDILLRYVKHVEEGIYTMSDRKEKSLMSAGDTQILFTGLKMGYYAGSSSKLELKHLIDTTKATINYATRLVYALNSSQLKAYLEVFPEKQQQTTAITNSEVVKLVISALRSFRLHSKEYTVGLYISKKLGELNARVVAYNLKKPVLLHLYANWIKR